MANAQVIPITGSPSVEQISPGIRCKAGSRHTDFEGHVYLRTISGVAYWVEVVQCKCSTWRTTKYIPNSGVIVGQRHYWRPKNSDWPDDLSKEDCQRIVLESMLAIERSSPDAG